MRPSLYGAFALAFVSLIVTPVESRESRAASGAVWANASYSTGFAGDRPSLARRDLGRGYRLVSFPGQIQHVVLIYMENRTPDDLFAGYARTPFRAGGTIGTALDVRDPLAKPTLAPNPLDARFDPNHYHLPGFVAEAAGHYDAVNLGCTPSQCPPNASVFSYVPAPEPSPYLALVSNFAYADHVLQSNAGPSFPAHQYAIAGQSGGLRDGFTSPFSIAPYADSENPRPTGRSFVADGDDALPDKGVPLGNCFSGTSYVENALDMQAPYPGTDGDLHPPCVDFQTILDEAADVLGPPKLADWQYVASRNDSIWAAPMSVAHLYQAFVDDPFKADEPFAVDPDAVNFVNDLYAARPVRPFAALTYITPCIHESDHPNGGGGASDGPAWLAYVVNAIGRSRYWPQTAIIATWDDWGGFYDHFRTEFAWPFHPFPNPYDNPQDPNEWGFRVPLIVISPYVRSRGYISTIVRSQGAILNYVERTFGLGSLRADDETNGTDDLGDMFDFGHAPLPYVPVTGGKQFDPTAIDCSAG